MKRIQTMARTNNKGEEASLEAAAELDKIYTEQQSRLQDQCETAMNLATESAIDSELDEMGPRPAFHPFPRLPAELQVLIWKEALENSYVLYKATRTVRGGLQEIITKRKLCNKRWMGILLACRTSYEIGKDADREVMEAGGKFRTWFTYWGSEKRWESKIRQENLKGNVVERDIDVRWY